MLHRKSLKKSNEISSSLMNSTGDNMINLPDLSAFQDAEKQHILDVLIRDEDLRNKHLSRFLNLQKEVNELEQQSKNSSTSICVRCQTPFGYIFNTGDACPKCTAKVCKQCRLLYNLNDNGWLCLLCSKQMQLMSYSGEWIYVLHSNLRKKSQTSSNNIDQSDLPSFSIQNIRSFSSSESESEEVLSPINKKFLLKTDSPSSIKNTKINKLIVQKSTDEEKLKFIKKSVEERPLTGKIAEKLVKRLDEVRRNSHRANPASSNTNSLLTLPTNQNGRDFTSTTSLERINDNEKESIGNQKPEKEKLKIKQLSHSSTRESKLSLASTITSKTSRKYLSASMQSLRDTVNRIPHHSSSGVSLNADKNHRNKLSNSSTIVNEDKLSLKMPEISSQTNSRLTLQTPQSSFDDSKRSLSRSSRLPSSNSTESEAIIQRNVSILESNISSEKLNNRQSTAESEDDIDSKFRKAKLGSQISINSTMSDAKARYDMDINGTIQLKLSYNINIGGLDIFIGKCTNLASNKRQQSINPYCKLYLLPDKSKNSKRKTSIKKSTTEPIFNETFRYYLGVDEFDSRTLSISIWSQSTITQNDFLGELQIPLAHCSLNILEDYKLSFRTQEDNIQTNLEASNVVNELQFQLSFIQHNKNKDIGTIQINHIHGKNLFPEKTNLELFCKGILLPNKLKRKIPILCKDSSPKWDIPLRWENIRREDLKTLSIEIIIGNQERFRKTLLGFIRLNSIVNRRKHETDKVFYVTQAERSIWEDFQQNPTKIYQVQLPLRSVINDNK